MARLDSVRRLAAAVSAVWLTHASHCAAQVSSNPELLAPAILFAAGHDYLQQGQYGAAAEMFHIGLYEEPRNGLAHYYLAEAVQRSGIFPVNLALLHYTRAARYLGPSPEGQDAARKAAGLLEREQAAAATRRKSEGLKRLPPRHYAPAEATYDGEWKGETPHGLGIFIYRNGSRYQGEVKNGKPDGSGTFSGRVGIIEFNDTEHIYSGGWANGVRHGHGRDISRTTRSPRLSQVSEGEFHQGVFVKGESLQGDGTRLRGEFHGWSLNGYGIMIKPDGTRVEGQWKRGELVGR